MRKKILKHFRAWCYRIGLRWWKIDTYWYKRGDRKTFRRYASKSAYASVYADWRYGTAVIHVYLPAFRGKTDGEIEEIVVHELVHILVNETQAGGIDHEERVVTGLTKAFMWTKEGL
jgi:hypothetical protein